MSHSSVYLDSSHKRTGICAESLSALINRQNNINRQNIINRQNMGEENQDYSIFWLLEYMLICLSGQNYGKSISLSCVPFNSLKILSELIGFFIKFFQYLLLQNTLMDGLEDSVQWMKFSKFYLGSELTGMPWSHMGNFIEYKCWGTTGRKSGRQLILEAWQS